MNAVNRAKLRAELVVNFPLVALAKEKQIRFAQRRQKGIRIARAARVAGFIRDDQVVGVNGIGQLGDAFKHVRVWNPLQLERGLVLFMHGLDLNFFGIRQERADDDAGFVPQRLHPQQRVRRLMGQFNETAQFIFGEQHIG